MFNCSSYLILTRIQFLIIKDCSLSTYTRKLRPAHHLTCFMPTPKMSSRLKSTLWEGRQESSSLCCFGLKFLYAQRNKRWRSLLRSIKWWKSAGFSALRWKNKKRNSKNKNKNEEWTKEMIAIAKSSYLSLKLYKLYALRSK